MEVLVERVESFVEIVAEGHKTQVEKLDNLAKVVDGHTRTVDDLGVAVRALQSDVGELRSSQDEMRTEQERFRSSQDEMRAEQERMRSDMNLGFKELGAQVSLSYSELDGRLRFLEHEVVDLRARLERVEMRLP